MWRATPAVWKPSNTRFDNMAKNFIVCITLAFEEKSSEIQTAHHVKRPIHMSTDNHKFYTFLGTGLEYSNITRPIT